MKSGTLPPLRSKHLLDQLRERIRYRHYSLSTDLPSALERKYPRAGERWDWFWVFPSAHEARDPRSGCADATICMRSRFNVRSGALPKRRAFSSLLVRTRCGIHSPRICSNADKTFAQFRNCSATVMSIRR
jgi:hypothetical protein